MYGLSAAVPDLCVVLNEEEEDHVLPEVLDGQVEGEGGASLEHVIEQRGTQLCKITCVQVVLCAWGGGGKREREGGREGKECALE